MPGTLVRLAGAAAAAAVWSLAAGASDAPVRLVGVSASTGARPAIVIEASEPVAYVVSRPDPLVIHLDLRNVSVSGAANLVRADARGPVVAVDLEQLPGIDAVPVGRVRLTLSAPLQHRVRSARNTITVELDATAPFVPLEDPAGPVYAPAIDRQPAPARADAPLATQLNGVRASTVGGKTKLTISGNGRLVPSSVTEETDLPPRVVLDFPGVIPRTAAETKLSSGPVRRVRVLLQEREPPATRVVIELARAVAYHVEPADPGSRALSVVFEDGRAAGPILLAPLPAGAVTVEPEPDVRADSLTVYAAPGAIDPMMALASGAQQAAPPGERAVPVQAQAPARPSPAPTSAAPPPATPPAPAQTPPPAPPRAQPAPQRPQPPAPQAAPPRQPPAGQTLPQPMQPTGERRYTGAPVTLDFVQGDLRAVLRLIGDVSGLNMVIDPAVNGTVDVTLTDLPWDHALDIILRTHKLGWSVEGTVVRIAPLTVLAEEEKQRRALAEEQALAGELHVRTIPLSYAKASVLQPLVTKAALSQRGEIQVDERTNMLIIRDLEERLDVAAELVARLDQPEPQVEIEARIVQTTRDFAKALGVQWGIGGRVAPDIGNTTPLAFPNRGTLDGRTGAFNEPQDQRRTNLETTPTAVNLPVPGATSAIGLALSSVNGALNLDLALSALERSGKGRVLSTPRVTTQNNVAAEMTQGIQIPIQTVANNTVTVTFKDSALKLLVTPQITSAGTVIMAVELENATPDFSRQVNNIPPIDTQRAKTQVQVNDGATTVLGGIFVSREQSTNERTPFLHRLPLLGWLFKRDTVSDESRELLIFITPRIVKG
jgi:type IV pilus assembly protein PilQ